MTPAFSRNCWNSSFFVFESYTRGGLASDEQEKKKEIEGEIKRQRARARQNDEKEKEI
jgi:hypothetical protein